MSMECFFHFFVSSLISFISFLQFSAYRSFTSLVRFIPRYFTVLGTIVKRIFCRCIISVQKCNKFLHVDSISCYLAEFKDLNMSQETIKILEEKTGNSFFDLGHSNFLLDMSPKAREIKAKMNYWDLIKIQNFCTAKETINKTKRQATE